jgi:flagellin
MPDTHLGSDAANAIDTTASEIKALLAADANSSDFISATLAEGTGAENVVANASVDVTSGAVDAFLVFRSKDFGSAQFVDINVLQGTFSTAQLSVGGTAAGRDEGTDVVATINGQVAQGKGLRASLVTSILDSSVTFKSANNVATTNAKVTVTGGGSLFKIWQEVAASGQVGVGIEGMNTARLGGATGKLYELGSGGGKSLIDVGPSVPGSTLVDILKEAIDDVTSLQGRLGALQKNIFKTNVTTLGVALESITEARSQIINTDFAAETASLTKAQILTQSGISVLAIANQTPSQVLSLLG